MGVDFGGLMVELRRPGLLLSFIGAFLTRRVRGRSRRGSMLRRIMMIERRLKKAWRRVWLMVLSGGIGRFRESGVGGLLFLHLQREVASEIAFSAFPLLFPPLQYLPLPLLPLRGPGEKDPRHHQITHAQHQIPTIPSEDLT